MSRRRPPYRPSEPRHAARAPAAGAAEAKGAGLWLFGRHAVAAALGNPARRCRRVLALAETEEDVASLVAGARASVPAGGVEILERRALDGLLPAGAVHQGMALAVEPLPAADIDDVLDAAGAAPAPRLLVVLDQVTDPHNIGAILRSAAAFGALALIVPEHGAPPVTGTLAKSASGALEAVPLVRVTNLARTLDRLKEAGYWSVGLDGEAPASLAALDLPDKIVLVLGAEGSGLRRLTREHCDFLARLPTRGAWRSLNVSNAAAVALYELTRATHETPPENADG
jgi:23S rRNA (guanosine2251-2'-O)-methyltransferase